jgi:hypothetical protein
MSARPALRVIDGDGEVLETASAEQENVALRAALTRAENVIKGLRNQLKDERKTYPRRALIERIHEDWQYQTGHKRSKLTDDRFDAIKSLVEKEYTFGHFQLVNRALAAYPFERYGRRYAAGSKGERKDDIGWCCEKGRRFEMLANLGHDLKVQDAA